MGFLSASSCTWLRAICTALLLCCLLAPSQQKYLIGTDAAGRKVYLDDARKPSLFTREFGDCSGSSVVDVTRFDAAYYKDNMTVVFHLQGSTNVKNESLMMYIGVYAYGESRFDLTFNPCNANIKSLCPMKAGEPIQANGIIPVAPVDVAGIPPIALTIPDFEGQAILRIFSNSTQSQIGCYSAVVTNGVTFSHPKAVGTVLGLFALLAVISSCVTALYGDADHIAVTRNHYAHSLSVLVVFAVLHHIYFTGVLSLDWPSVLPAFWSNYAWAGGMIYSQRMQRSINRFLGSNQRNASFVGAGSSATNSPQLLFNLQSIYQDLPAPKVSARSVKALAGVGWASAESLTHRLAKRASDAATDDFPWYGKPVPPGLPLPGTFFGFAGTLAQQSIPLSNAFLTGLLWFLILIACMTAAIVLLKWTLELLSAVNLVKKDRLSFFRSHWIRFAALAALRAVLAAFFMMLLLTFFQFAYGRSAGVLALAAIVFCILFFGLCALAGYACLYRLRQGDYEVKHGRLCLKKTLLWKFVPWPQIKFESQQAGESSEHGNNQTPGGLSVLWRKLQATERDEGAKTVHEDTEFIMRFGWLTARFRQRRWWFFTLWMAYEFIRACFFGGAVRNGKVQVFGLLVVELIAFILTIRLRPFEGARLNALLVYLLGFSKLATMALSVPFETSYKLPRIKTTILGIVIIVVQGVLTIALLIAIVMGAVSSYMSLTRNREHFKPRSWAPMRQKYFQHIEKAAKDEDPQPASPVTEPEPVAPYFKVSSVRRFPKIEDEDPEFVAELQDPSASRISVNPGSMRVGSRRNSASANSIVSHHNAPPGARVHRASWSTRDFDNVRALEKSRATPPSFSHTPARIGTPLAIGNATIQEDAIAPV